MRRTARAAIHRTAAEMTSTPRIAAGRDAGAAAAIGPATRKWIYPGSRRRTSTRRSR